MSILAGTRDASLGGRGVRKRRGWGESTRGSALGQRRAQGLPVLEALVADEDVVLQREAELAALRVGWWWVCQLLSGFPPAQPNTHLEEGGIAAGSIVVAI
jgi:hypothetical protein